MLNKVQFGIGKNITLWNKSNHILTGEMPLFGLVEMWLNFVYCSVLMEVMNSDHLQKVEVPCIGIAWLSCYNDYHRKGTTKFSQTILDDITKFTQLS